ncbi:tyrosine-type recombinase/integrase [Acidihalobacter ferrooxydans]|uniref:Integrase n=1 Tax=Acidihalobacter ferrooxydans TaxID=1765967 RepID=A0A1P8UIS2_9GAMM|nr:tyrosine-type recombinase/integrase [Acidihalobacter ferrooxydans]APZ43738.1 integrase [Acidihalobacter ferrooxydans]
MSTRVFQSFLGPDIEQFLAYKRSLGRRYDVEEKSLALLDIYLLNNNIGSLAEITPTLVDEFLLSRPRSQPRSYNHLRCTLERLFSYLVDREKLSTTPLQSPPRRVRYQRTPFIFDADAARRLLSLARTLQDKGGSRDRGSTYFALFAVLYGLGLRVGEACRLRIDDVDLERQLLIIRETKFYKSRLVPFGPKVGAVLAQHRHQRQVVLAGAPSGGEPLFSLRAGRPINPCTISQVFHALVPRLELEIPPGVSPPRLHDLRHSFAVGALTRWYRQGVDPMTKLLALSTILGHVDVNSTAVYLTTTPELLEQANRRFQAFATATQEVLS